MKGRLKEKQEVHCWPIWRDLQDASENEKAWHRTESHTITRVKEGESGDKILCDLSSQKCLLQRDEQTNLNWGTVYTITSLDASKCRCHERLKKREQADARDQRLVLDERKRKTNDSQTNAWSSSGCWVRANSAVKDVPGTTGETVMGCILGTRMASLLTSLSSLYIQ